MYGTKLRKYLRKKAYERISFELAKFKERMLKQSPEKIFDSSYEIDSYFVFMSNLLKKQKDLQMSSFGSFYSFRMFWAYFMMNGFQQKIQEMKSFILYLVK